MKDAFTIWALLAAHSAGHLCPMPANNNSDKHSAESKQAAITKSEAKRQRKLNQRKKEINKWKK